MISAFLAIIIVFALCAIAYGGMSVFAGGMSDNPSAGRDAENSGVKILCIGLVVLIVCITIAVWRSYHGA